MACFIIKHLAQKIPFRSAATSELNPRLLLSVFVGTGNFNPKRNSSNDVKITLPVIKSIPVSYVITRNYSKREKSKEGYRSDSDSDSDDEHTIKRERGEFWLRKMRTFHGLLDVNKDGVISYDDYKLLADKFTALGHLDAEASKEFSDVMKQTWETQWGEISPYNLVTVEKYISEMQHVLNDKALRKKLKNFLPYIFKAVDNDQSGFISLVEFKLFFNCLGLTDEDAAVSFAVIDKNGDGKLSIKEFVKLGRDFFVTEEEKRPSRMFWGPLCN